MEQKKCYTKEDILAQLASMGAPVGSVVLMHTSMRAVGPVEGGAQGLLDAMVDYFTKDGGLLCVPTHTWHNLDKEITLDMTSSDTCLGVFSTVAAADPRGLRTENPTHSMVIFGDRARAEKFAAGEIDVRTPIAPDSCYGKLFTEEGYVLLVGVAQNRNTYLHTVEEMLEVPNRMADTPTPVAVRRPSGEIVRREMKLFYTDYNEDICNRFLQFDTAFRYWRCIRDGFIGNAPAQLCNARKLKETLERIYKGSGGIDPLADEAPIPQKWYC